MGGGGGGGGVGRENESQKHDINHDAFCCKNEFNMSIVY